MNELQRFEFPATGQEVRTVSVNGEPWFVVADVATVLELGNPRSSLARLDEDEKGVHTMDTLGGPQPMATVNEPGLYSLILRSRKPEAKVFKRWITHEVLPTIRRYGSYALTPVGSDDPFEPDAFSWRETCTIIRQQYEVRVSVPRLRRVLMMAGVLNQNFEPKAGFEHCFWFTGTAYLVFRHCVPAIFFHYQAAERKLEAIGGGKELASGYDQGNLFAIEGGAS